MKHRSGCADAWPWRPNIAEASNRTHSVGTASHPVYGYVPVEFRGATGTVDRGPRQRPAESADPEPAVPGGKGMPGSEVREESRDPNQD